MNEEKRLSETEQASPAADAAEEEDTSAARQGAGAEEEEAAPELAPAALAAAEPQAGEGPDPGQGPPKGKDGASKPGAQAGTGGGSRKNRRRRERRKRAAERAQKQRQEEQQRLEEEQRQKEEQEQQRLADMTRTVQVSVEQILAHAAEMEKQQAEAAAAEESAPTLREGVRAGMFGILKWLLLVLFFVAIIAGMGIAWLYRGATPDMLPQIDVTFDGQALQPTSYDWHVPVVNDLLTRQYEQPASGEAYVLPAMVGVTHPEVQIAPLEYESEIAIRDEDGQELFSGPLLEFQQFAFEENGVYTGELTLHSGSGNFAGVAHVSGTQSYLFQFTVSIRPTVRLDSSAVDQGSVVAVMVTGLMEGDVPTLDTTLETPGFVPASNGWIAFVPVPWDEAPGEYHLRVGTKDYNEDLTLTVNETHWEVKDHGSTSQLIWPFIGQEDTPQQVLDLLDVCDQELGWRADGFVQPFVRKVGITLSYGTGEYVGRTAAQIATASEEGGRHSINTVVYGNWGDSVMSPADGRVLWAEDLGDVYGNTVVIEHGGGLKSIFYRLQTLEVARGDTVKQRQVVGTSPNSYIVEARVGQVPVDPLKVWRGQCNAFKYY